MFVLSFAGYDKGSGMGLGLCMDEEYFGDIEA